MRILLSLALCAVALGLAGCEDDVDPTLGTDQVFSLYGYLDPTADRQSVRVVPIVPTINSDTSATIDAVVTSTDLGTGVVTAWRDSLVTYRDGSRGHVFVADYTPAPDGARPVHGRRLRRPGRDRRRPRPAADPVHGRAAGLRQPGRRRTRSRSPASRA